MQTLKFMYPNKLLLEIMTRVPMLMQMEMLIQQIPLEIVRNHPQHKILKTH